MIKYNVGDVVGSHGMVLLERLPQITSKRGKGRKAHGVFRCGYCGNITKAVEITAVAHGSTKSCGCLANNDQYAFSLSENGQVECGGLVLLGTADTILVEVFDAQLIITEGRMCFTGDFRLLTRERCRVFNSYRAIAELRA